MACTGLDTKMTEELFFFFFFYYSLYICASAIIDCVGGKKGNDYMSSNCDALPENARIITGTRRSTLLSELYGLYPLVKN